MCERRKCPIVINNEPRYEYVASDVYGKRKRSKKSTGTSRQTTESKRLRVTVKDKPALEKAILTQEFPLDQSQAECSDAHKSTFDTDVAYLQLLTTHNAVTPVEENYRAFLLQDIDIGRNKLKDEYVIVQRRVVQTAPNGLEWLYGCSCNPARQRMVDALSTNLSGSVEEALDAPYRKCHHINATEQLATGFNDSLGLTMVMEFEKEIELLSGSPDTDHDYGKYIPKVNLYGLESSNRVICVSHHEHQQKPTYTVVVVDFKAKKPILRCMTCQKENCKHSQFILNQNSETSDVTHHVAQLLNQEVKWRSRYIPQAVSVQKIPFSVAPEEMKQNRRHLMDLQRDDGLIHLLPDSIGFCPCGSIWGEPTILEDVQLITSVDVLPGKAYIRKCTNAKCTQWKDYDGVDDQLLNMGTYVVSHQILRGYLRQFVTEGTPLASYYKELCWQQIDSGNLNFSDTFSFNRLRYAWYCFVDLLDADYASGFVCPQCGDNPHTVVMDGVTLGIRKSYMPWKDHMSRHMKPQTLDGSSHNTRVFVNNQLTRLQLQKYVTSTLTEEEFQTLTDDLARYQPCLNDLMSAFSDIGAMTCPSIYVEFLKCLSKNSPVCGLLHYNESLLALVSELSLGVNVSDRVDDIILLEKLVPILSALLQKLDWNIPTSLQPVLAELVKKTKATFHIKPHNLPTCTDDCPCTGIGYFPHLPKRCHRGDYVLDDRKKQFLGDCQKSSPRHASLTPGLFTLSCTHGVCYGFQLMEDVESPNTPFTILRTRFQRAPKMVIYDNACNLHNYCLNRDPTFFRDTWFMVDRFHWVNHKGCHQGYNLSQYLQYNYINTQVAEQRNSTFKKLKSMLCYMNIQNYTKHLKLFVWFRSMIK